MINYPNSLVQIGGARTGVTPCNLLDVQDVNGNIYYFSDRAGMFVPVITPTVVAPSKAGAGNLISPVSLASNQYVAWSYPSAAASSGSNNGSGSSSGTALGNQPGTGLITMNWSRMGTGWFETWSQFNIPALPSGAVVQQVYVCMRASHTSSASAGATAFLYENNAYPSGWADNSLYAFKQVNLLISSSADLSFIPTTSFKASLEASLYQDGLSDVLTVSDIALAVIYTSAAGGGNPSGLVQYDPWIIDVGEFRFYRSLQSDTGSIVLQNVSGDSMKRDFEVLKTKSALEGALAVYRCWQADAEAAWIEMHALVTVDSITESEATLKLTQLLDASNTDSAGATLSESCGLEWASLMCGSTHAQECQYSFTTCQVPERYRAVLSYYEKNYGETTATTPSVAINRRRKI